MAEKSEGLNNDAAIALRSYINALEEESIFQTKRQCRANGYLNSEQADYTASEFIQTLREKHGVTLEMLAALAA